MKTALPRVQLAPARRAILAAVLLAGIASTFASGCRRPMWAVVWVGESAADPIPVAVELLEVSVRARGEERIVSFGPPEDEVAIPIPTSFYVEVDGLDNDDRLQIDVLALGGPGPVAFGSASQIVFFGWNDFDIELATISTACGNGGIDPGEACDGPDLGGNECATVGMGFVGGELACGPACQFDTLGCVAPKGCGDGTVQAGEQCDGQDLMGQDCPELGFDGGNLTCTAGCVFDVSGCEGGATPDPPVLRKPMNNSYMGSVHRPGSLQPRFEWEPSTLAGVTYELDYSGDPGFDAGDPTTVSVMISTPFHEVAADLPVGSSAPVGARYYWRVRVCVADNCSGPSPTWWVNVGRSDRDFNGDGYADVVVGAAGNDVVATDAGRIFIYYGSGAGIGSVPDGTAPGGALSDLFGSSVDYAGDLNADGFADIIVGAPGNDLNGTDAGAALVYAGRAGIMFGLAPALTLPGLNDGDQFGFAVSGAGDLNMDGFDDFVVTGPFLTDSGDPDAGFLHYYYGATDISGITVEGSMNGGGPGHELGTSVDAAGDVNGDGFGDLIVGVPGDNSVSFDQGSVQLVFGASGLPGTLTPDVILDGETTMDRFGTAVAGVGDVNLDGFADFVVGAPDYDTIDLGAAYLVFGSGTGMVSTGLARVVGTVSSEHLGETVAGAGDVDGDGAADVLIGSPGHNSAGANTGQVSLYFGDPSMFDLTPDAVMTGMSLGDAFGAAIAGAGDLDADGFDELVIGAPGRNSGEGEVYVFSSMFPGWPATPAVTLTPVAADTLFGSGVARLLVVPPMPVLIPGFGPTWAMINELVRGG